MRLNSSFSSVALRLAFRGKQGQDLYHSDVMALLSQEYFNLISHWYDRVSLGLNWGGKNSTYTGVGGKIDLVYVEWTTNLVKILSIAQNHFNLWIRLLWFDVVARWQENVFQTAVFVFLKTDTKLVTSSSCSPKRWRRTKYIWWFTVTEDV